MAETKTGWAYFVGDDGATAPALTDVAVRIFEAIPGETSTQALERIRTAALGGTAVTTYAQSEVRNVVKLVVSQPPTTDPNTGNDGGAATALTQLTPSTSRPAALYGLGISRDKATRETRIWFNNEGGAASVQWIVTDWQGKTIAGAGWPNQAVYQPGLTDFVGFGYQSTARLSPTIDGQRSITEGVDYLLGLILTVGGQTVLYVHKFQPPTATTTNGPVALTLPDVEGTTGNGGGGTGNGNGNGGGNTTNPNAPYDLSVFDADTAASWAGDPVYGPPVLVYSPELWFFNPVVTVNNDGTCTVTDASTYSAPPGKKLVYKIDYYGNGGNDITTLDGKVYRVGVPIYIQKFQVDNATPWWQYSSHAEISEFQRITWPAQGATV